MKKIKRRIKNFFFCMKYPFWRSRNVFTGKFMGYDFTWYDDIPEGWQIAFGKQLSEDIAKALKKDRIPRRKWTKSVCWEQIKEKFGELRLYCSTTDAVQEVLNKYEYMSIGYCIQCGQPARYCTEGWITYLCPTCFMKDIHQFKFGPKEKRQVIKRCRLTKKDIPHIVRFQESGHGEIEVNLKEEYGVDLNKLWDV